MEILHEIPTSYGLSGFNTSLFPYLSIFLIKKKRVSQSSNLGLLYLLSFFAFVCKVL